MGAQLVSDNCGECEGRSIGEFDRGVRLVEEALREGVARRKEARLALVDAYSEYAFSYDKARPMDEETRASWCKRLAGVYRDLLREDPANVDLLVSYAGLLDSASALKVLVEALRTRPADARILSSLACLHISIGDIGSGVDEFIRAVRLRSVDPRLIEGVLPGFVWDLRARKGAQYIAEVSGAAFDTLAAQAKGGSARAAFAAAILHVELGQPKLGVEEFIRATRLESADEKMIYECLENIRLYLYEEPRENAQYIEQVSAAAAGALQRRADAKARAKDRQQPARP
jgi:hypothetical protein